LPDALVLAATHAPDWVTDAEAAAKKWLEPIRVSFGAGRLMAHFPGSGAGRRWFAAVLPRAEAIDAALIGKRLEPPPQRLRTKHSDLPLDLVKDWTLRWPAASGERPRLMLTPTDMAHSKASQPIGPGEAARIARLPLNEFNLADLVDYQLRTGDPATRRRMSEAALPAMQSALRGLLKQDGMFSLGFAPHHLRDIAYAAHLADFAFADPEMPESDKAKIRSGAAALSYMLQRPDYWSQTKGFAANPNMSSLIAGFQGLLACLLHDHPSSRQWLDTALGELFDRELLSWSDENGGWLEAPHYSLASQDAILGTLLCARNAGRLEFLEHPRLRRFGEWLAKITTPPDVRNGGLRSLPPIGNTMMLEPTGQFGILAYLFRDIDPAFSARMQWMHVASGSPIQPVVGGFLPIVAPYQISFKDARLPSVQPAYGSELFPRTGAILRAHFGTDRETQLHVIAGTNHAHYDHDSGSITFWGKGRLLANDWGYSGYAPASEHSMVDGKSIAGEMRIDRFVAGPAIDTFAGTSGAWIRRIALVKDDDSTGANFVVLSDSLAGGREATWRLWLTGERRERHNWGVELIGRDDVDMDVVFLGGVPAGLDFETKTVRSVSSIKGPMDTTQTAITVPMNATTPLLRVLLLPRLKGEASPQVRFRAGGDVIEVRTPRGSDTILWGSGVFEYRDDNIVFKGTSGLVRLRAGKLVLALGDAGRIEASGQSLEADAPRLMTWSNP
jgi:hypothetical protein